MLTDAPPRKKNRQSFVESGRLRSIDLPADGRLCTTMLIRVWMKTVVRKEITSSGSFLSTLCHQFCHHLDFHEFKFRDSWHTRGFYERASILYHHARGTSVKQLVSMPATGQRWRIDWARTNRAVLRMAPSYASITQHERTA